MEELFWDIGHTGITTSSNDGAYMAERAESKVEDLEHRIDRLSMICCGMWTILQAHADVSDADLIRLVQELDLADGHLDGKATVKQVQDCGTCGRPVALRHPRCLYCGAPRQRGNPFDDVL